jgi:diadenosine hexaphosphate hydrolase (ATP-forming)
VVFRRLDDQVEYLLVRPKKGSPEWVLPKGHIERGEGIRETAVREVREETGIWASIRDELECVSFVVDGEPISVQFYLMEAVGRGCPSELRKHAWMRLDEAAGNASHPETQRLLMSVKKIPEPLGTRSILRRLLQCAVATKQQHSGQQ